MWTRHCDNCGEDLTESQVRDASCIQMRDMPIANRSGVYRDAVTPEPLRRAYHFCHVKCMEQWLVSDKDKPLMRMQIVGG